MTMGFLKPLSAVLAWPMHWSLEREMRFLALAFLPPVMFGFASSASAMCGWTTAANIMAPMVMLWILAAGLGTLICARPGARKRPPGGVDNGGVPGV